MLTLARLVVAGLSGLLTYAAIEPRGWWWAAIVGVGLLYASLLPWGTRHVSARVGALLAVTHSLVLYLLTLPWIGELVGSGPYIALAVWLSVYAIVLGLGGAAVARWKYGFIAFPFFYLAVEVLRSSVPFGGFSWVKLAWGQIDGPLANLAPWGGTSLITAATVLCGCGLAALLVQRGWKAKSAALLAAILPLASATVAGLGINRDDSTVGEAKVAAVQGNVPRMGLDLPGNAKRSSTITWPKQRSWPPAKKTLT